MSVFVKDHFCSGCGISAPETYRFCRSCGLELAEDEVEFDQAVFLPPPGSTFEEGKSWFTRIVEWGIIGGIIFVLAAIATPNFRRTGERSPMKACYANQRVILGAVEMYNMDHSVMISTISDADVSENGLLVKGSYLKSKISKPTPGCSYAATGDLTGPGKITCAAHGPVEEETK
ncbi:MAG: hypothetical protein WA705_11490 [Candidatus Ozemobacteraceae bacterium]